MQVILGSLNKMLHKWKVMYRLRLLKVVKAAYQQYYGEK